MDSTLVARGEAISFSNKGSLAQIVEKGQINCRKLSSLLVTEDLFDNIIYLIQIWMRLLSSYFNLKLDRYSFNRILKNIKHVI